jgi:hypothetical protein
MTKDKELIESLRVFSNHTKQKGGIISAILDEASNRLEELTQWKDIKEVEIGQKVIAWCQRSNKQVIVHLHDSWGFMDSNGISYNPTHYKDLPPAPEGEDNA